jgi:hypothetical protein
MASIGTDRGVPVNGSDDDEAEDGTAGELPEPVEDPTWLVGDGLLTGTVVAEVVAGHVVDVVAMEVDVELVDDVGAVVVHELDATTVNP